MATGKDEKMYKIRGLPKAVEKELRKAANASEISVRRAFRFVLASVPDVAEAIAIGQKMDVRDEERGVLQMHLPAKEKRAIDRYAKAAGVDRCEVGRFVLASRRGSLHAAIVQGMAKPVSGVEVNESETETAAH